MSRLFEASVLDNRQLAENHYLITLHPAITIRKPRPGNFFMLSVDSGLDPLLKRPFSLHRCHGSDIQFLYRVVGKGTSLLRRKKPKDVLEVIGPLGNAFPVSKNSGPVILVAGGLGIAPIFALAESILKKNPLLFYGARTKSEALCLDRLNSIGIDPVISTDDGTLGERGTVIDILEKQVSAHSLPVSRCTLYACGPQPMLKALARFTLKYKIPAYAALEQHMACGIGTCLGCVVKTRKGYQRVCKEGPVFAMDEIIW